MCEYLLRACMLDQAATDSGLTRQEVATDCGLTRRFQAATDSGLTRQEGATSSGRHRTQKGGERLNQTECASET